MSPIRDIRCDFCRRVLRNEPGYARETFYLGDERSICIDCIDEKRGVQLPLTPDQHEAARAALRRIHDTYHHTWSPGCPHCGSKPAAPSWSVGL